MVEITPEHLNVSKAESAANTLTYDQYEVPNSQGAKRVFLEDIMLTVSHPDLVASTKTMVEAIAIRGKLDAAPGAVNISQVGAVHQISSNIWCDATPLPVAVDGSVPDDREGPFEIPKYRDGKFYLTLAIKGTACTAVKTVYCHAEFSIER
jgi:hypothetical protein